MFYLRALLIAAALFQIVVAGCSKEDETLSSIRENISKNNYEEVITLCEHALRRDVDDAEVYYYYGLALLETGREFESFRRFHEAVEGDSTLAGRAAGRLAQKGKEALQRGDSRRAADRLREAAALDPSVELGPYKFVVADAFYRQREFALAADLYDRAIVERPDSSVSEQAYFRLSECRVAMSDTALAIEALEGLLDNFPKGEFADRAEYKLSNLVYESAQAEFVRGNYEKVNEEILSLLERAENRTLVQRARFLLGESYERQGNYKKAYEQYRAIIDEDRGASGRIVDRARSKINAFRDSGLL